MGQISWNQYKHVVILTGAGISAPSGIQTFRDAGGLWENHAIEEVATPEAFENNPHLVWQFYSLRRQNAGSAVPNSAHIALDQFAKDYDGHLTLVTQNVDGLHQRARKAGHLDPICMHGSLEQSRCTACGHVWWDDMVWVSNKAPYSSGMLSPDLKSSPDSLTQYQIQLDSQRLPLSPCCQSLLRPHIVWFGEEPLAMGRILREVEACDLFISIGTSGVVYPAAAFIQIAQNHGAYTMIFNLEEISHQAHVDEFIQGSADQTIPEFFKI
jgi:NAD-dependent deacetylase